jgi:hypothetical protein
MAVKFNHRREFDILENEMDVLNCSEYTEIYEIFWFFEVQATFP